MHPGIIQALFAAVLFGASTPQSLNLEGVFTAVLAWFVFRENFDARIALGMGLIVTAGALLSWEGSAGFTLPVGALAVIGACLAWAIDNNLTRKVSAGDPVQIAAIKGLVAGTSNTEVGLLKAHSLLRSQQGRPRRQIEQRHLRRQRFVEDGGDDVQPARVVRGDWQHEAPPEDSCCGTVSLAVRVAISPSLRKVYSSPGAGTGFYRATR